MYGKSLLPLTVGYDRLLSTIQEMDNLFPEKKVASYPPYNIIKNNDSEYTIEIAVAGFDKNDIDITLENQKLSVNGSSKIETTKDYLYHGIGTRNFSHTYRLADTVVVDSADIVNGLLQIKLKNIIPDEMKPKKIAIGNLLS